MKTQRPKYHIGFTVDFSNERANVSWPLMTVVGYRKLNGEWHVDFENDAKGLSIAIPISRLI